VTRRRKLSRTLLLGLICLAGRGVAEAQFETFASVSTAAASSSVAVGDFNHDGKLDLAVANTNLQVFLGNGDGTFQAPLNYLVGTGALFVAAGDLNGDGNLDLVVTDLDGLFVMIGNGDGTFQTPTSYSTPCQIPYSINVGDFNGDHKSDLIVTYSSGDCAFVSVFLGNGDGTFQEPPVNSPTLFVGPIGIGDFNRDGKLDVAVGGYGFEQNVEILPGNGDGTFSEGGTFSADYPYSIAVADLRGNGDLDLVIANEGISVLLGNGDGTFQPQAAYPAVNALWLAVADFNNDGRLDVAAVSESFPAGVSVLLGKGDGTLQASTFYLAGKDDRFVAVGDFNGDHRTDILIPDYAGETVVLLNTGVASISPTTPINFPFQLVGVSSPAQTVNLTNTGTKALSISSLKVTSPFHESNNCGKSLAAGANCKIEITFKPQNTSNVTGTVTISDSASSKPQVIELSGAGTVVKLAPTKLAFGDQKVGTQSGPQKVTVSNEGTAPLSLTLIYVGGTNWHDFSESNNCPSSLNAQASCTVTVTFDPIKTGTRSAVLGFSDNGGGSPQTVTLTGTGD